MTGKQEYGDYQTPVDFAEIVCKYIKKHYQVKPSAVVEPTCGSGNLLKSSLLFDAKEYYGIEINSDYCNFCRSHIDDKRVKIINSDFFTFSSKLLIKDATQVLVIGNPPWCTNSKLSAINSNNLPAKTNFKELKGIEAITGASNFDICEYIILRIIDEYKNTNTMIVMLCKTTVARNIFQEIKRKNISFSTYDLLNFNAEKVFGVNANACILIIQLSNKSISLNSCNVYDFEQPFVLQSKFGFYNKRFYSNLKTDMKIFDGQCCFKWRQGVKHDCSKVMELTLSNGLLQNGKKENVDIEGDIVFPLVKSSMFKTPVIHNFSKFVIVTQRKTKEETEHLKYKVPKTWKYLKDNIELFKSRKSVIYDNAPLFSMFGVGDYSYSLYKVGISGFYKKPLFSVLFSEDKKPVMTDDTSYFICFDNFNMAYTAMLLLNSSQNQDFLESITFLDAKRPYTKKVLERIDFYKIINYFAIEELVKTEQMLKLPKYIDKSIYNAFCTLVMDSL